MCRRISEAHELVDPGRTPEEIARAKEKIRAVHDAFMRLAHEELSDAAICQCSPKAVETRIYRARRQILRSPIPANFLKKKIGISISSLTLFTVIVLKSIVGLVLGLVLQLSHAGPGMAKPHGNPCAAHGHGMNCCEGLASCPCAQDSRENERPVPLLPASTDLKSFIAKAPEGSRLQVLVTPPADTKVVENRPALGRSGYAGVPLSVAFCTFTI